MQKLRWTEPGEVARSVEAYGDFRWVRLVGTQGAVVDDGVELKAGCCDGARCRGSRQVLRARATVDGLDGPVWQWPIRGIARTIVDLL